VAIKFENQIQRDVYRKVGQYLRESFGDVLEPVKDLPFYSGIMVRQ